MDKKLKNQYGNKVRMRVCGVCMNENNEILLANMKGITSSLEENTDFFAPVGGGIEVGETATQALKREFLEEAGIEIEIDYFMCVYEYINLPIHALELFFAVRAVGGTLRTGLDPEHLPSEQIIKNVDYYSYKQILELSSKQRHGIFKYANSIENMKKLRGYIRSS